jgi:hypothetical protein
MSLARLYPVFSFFCGWLAVFRMAWVAKRDGEDEKTKMDDPTIKPKLQNLKLAGDLKIRSSN